VLASVLEVAAANLRHTDTVELFEMGLSYRPHAGEKLPDELPRLALVLSGRRHAEFWAEPAAAPAPLDFFDLKGVVEALVADLHLPEVRYQPAKVAYLHPGRAAELTVQIGRASCRERADGRVGGGA